MSQVRIDESPAYPEIFLIAETSVSCTKSSAVALSLTREIAYLKRVLPWVIISLTAASRFGFLSFSLVHLSNSEYL